MQSRIFIRPMRQYVRHSNACIWVTATFIMLSYVTSVAAAVTYDTVPGD